ncbi:unnamed protein product [Dovyalis caffra]|uniref:Uncharacterized protein n=1 Tax=Dovyalis caffra TaxID=77055 RepID=A0AAV1RUJ2_9ROSI|nr:unnamed protein product [Dovyalis caffra]
MTKPPQEEEDEERLRQRKLEEALEVKSLRRIISAYLNYPEAAEEDVKRYERSFRKLSPSHKALLSHYPFKFQSLRRRISENSYFIFNMLQAFEPPLDMSQDVDDCGCSHLEQPPNDGNVCSHESAAASGSCCSKPDEACCGKPSNMMSKPEDGLTANEEVHIGGCCGSDTGSCPAGRENNKMTAECCGNHVSYSNGNVPSSPRDWLDSSPQLHVPLVDVDKVRCIIRNIVRDWAAEEMSIELSLEDVKRVALNYGFEIEKEKTIETTYTTNPQSMMQNRYSAAFWTMKKKSAAVEKHST